MPEHTIAENLQRLINARQNIDGAIVTKEGTVNPGDGLEEYPADILTIPSGGGGSGAATKDVNFYDYDGTVVNSYTAAEFAELAAMPDNPSHDGLTAQGWNWSLADAKAYVTEYGKLNIGQMYNTDDGALRLCVHLEEGRLSPTLGICVNGTVTVDWGDNSATETMTGTSVTTLVYLQHAYQTGGDYVISVLPSSESTIGFGARNSISTILCKTSSDDANDRAVYLNTLYKVEISSSVTSISGSAFRSCYALTSVTIPSSVTEIDNYAFDMCYALTSVTIPSSVTSIGGSAFQNCHALTSVTIPNSVTNIKHYTFQNCHALTSVTIPNSVTSIESYVFQNCYALTFVIISSNITAIGGYAFQNCYALTAIAIDNVEGSIGGAPWGAPESVRVMWRVNRYKSSYAETATNTTLTGAVNATIGDLVVVAFEVFGSSYSISEGWTLLGDGTVTGSGNYSQKTGMAYKIATSASETFTVTQDRSTRAFISMVSITGASIGSFSGYTAQTDGTSITINKPNDLVIWSVSTVWWGSGWLISNAENNVNISTTRNLLSLDQSDSASVTFTNDNATSPSGILAASLTITGIDNFWYVG